MKRIMIGLVGLVSVSTGPQAGEKLTYEDLVRRLTDLEQVAVLPLPGERCALASSYDRASRYDEASGKYVAWDANGDGGGIIRKEGETSVLAEIEGPGCPGVSGRRPRGRGT